MYGLSEKSGVYKLTNKINGKIYIGKAINILKRITEHKNEKRKISILYKAIKKYGWENFEVEILQDFDYIDNLELFALETAYIDFFDSIYREKGYNINLFGTGSVNFRHSEETKKKISLANKGRLLGENHPLYGKHQTQETINKIIQSKLGKKPEKAIIASILARNRKIKQLDLKTNEVIKIWSSIKEAANTLGFRHQFLWRVLNNIRKSYKGYGWQYE